MFPLSYLLLHTLNFFRCGDISSGRCEACGKRCRLFEDSDVRDQRRIQNILKPKNQPSKPRSRNARNVKGF